VEEAGGGAPGPFEDLEVIRQDAAMPVSRFCQITGIPRRTCHRHLAKVRRGARPVKGPWPAPAVDRREPVAAKYAADWPAWGHRKIHAMMAADGHQASVSTAERAMRRRGLLQPIGYTGQRRELAKARKAASAEPPVRPDEVRQPGFSEYETTTGGTWRLAGVTDDFSKYEHGWHISPTCTGAGAIEAVKIAIAEAERIGGAPLLQLLPSTPRPATRSGSAWSPLTAARSREPRSRSSPPHGPSCCTSAPAPRARARTASANARSDR
jgi:putative transposase